MSNKNTGGAAFPSGYVSKTRPAHDSGADFRVTAISEPAQKGMTIRDYFAAKAMQGMISTAGAPCLNGVDGIEGIMGLAAYKIADAMLKARES